MAACTCAHSASALGMGRLPNRERVESAPQAKTVTVRRHSAVDTLPVWLSWSLPSSLALLTHSAGYVGRVRCPSDHSRYRRLGRSLVLHGDPCHWGRERAEAWPNHCVSLAPSTISSVDDVRSPCNDRATELVQSQETVSCAPSRTHVLRQHARSMCRVASFCITRFHGAGYSSTRNVRCRKRRRMLSAGGVRRNPPL